MLKSSVGMATLIFERYGYQCQQRQFSSQLSSFDGVSFVQLFPMLMARFQSLICFMAIRLYCMTYEEPFHPWREHMAP